MTLIKYTEDHEYISVEDGVGTIGITDYAQGKLGDVTFVELPKKGEKVKQGQPIAVVESVKAASDIYSPASGEIVEINETLNDQPDLINREPEAGAWLYKLALSNTAELDKLMDRDAYLAYASAEG
ncbi:glycine cleavage system protein GcvH [Rhodomicrobium sp. Az07]|uniref:glycine cleavage system protein GcvH n=1 Tax=Rhodomicrobium sp. Az07 TaxID=2839034 RepID=UPI001BE95DE7|nr:glycine cleavage system protein GcvH [Rhodomicrobium sp. Az07]MBT3071572.1 glycine cleavage system protein GcvH [Rhodomicrobium sp. Az07]